MAPQAKKQPKPIFKTALPFTETRWPAITVIQRNNILDLLCNLLQPLGDHRRTHIQPSKGKKRKRKSKQISKDVEPQDASANNTSTEQEPTPPTPDIANHILIGLNTVTRHLEALAAQNAPPNSPLSTKTPTPAPGDKTSSSPSSPSPTPLSLLILPHNHPPSSLPHAHLPTLLYLSTQPSNEPPSNPPPSPATRLIALPPSCEARIAETLHIPHVGALGILEGAPGADALVEYVRGNVGIVQCKWIDEAVRGEWMGVKFDGRQR